MSFGARAEVIIQYFETRWDEMYQRLPEIAEIGYESIWTPPPGKSPIGGPYPHAYGGNVGYNSYDRFDVGDHPQRGHWETRYGSRTSLRNLSDNAHQMDLKIYPDIVFNHTGNGPDYRTYPGMVPQDFHGWNDAGQPGGFKRAPRMFIWDAANGYGGTLHQELVSLMDIVLEFDGRFQGNNSPGYAPDPTPFVRHPGDPEKYPYFSQTGFVNENSRQFVTRWINWLGYAMDYDGVRLDAPKHVGKEYFGLPGQSQAVKDQTLIYNIQKNFNERRGLTDPDPFDDMYSNYIRRDDALVYSEFFIGSIGETDYWRNPSDRNWGIQTRYLDFPRKSQMIMAAFNGGNLAALDNIGAGFSPEEGVIFAHSHDEDPPGKLELAYAYILTRVGTPVVYFTGNNLADNEDKEENGITWMRKGYDGALGDFNMGTIPNLVYIHNQFARGREWTRWAEGDFFVHERYDDLNGNGQPNSGEGLLLVALNDSGFDQTRNGIQTSFAPGTVLKDYTGRNPDLVTVGSDGRVNIRVPGWWGQGFVCYAPFNARGPASGAPITFTGSGVSTMPWVVPGGRDAAAKNRTITRLTGNTATINVSYREPEQGGETVNNVLLKWGQGRNLNASAQDFTDKNIVINGYEQMTKVPNVAGQYQLVADLTDVPEGLHTIKARVFNGRAANRPALYQTFTTTVYVDRRGPDLAFVNLNEGETVEGARVVTVENADRTLHNLTYSINGGPAQQADQVIQGRWRIALDGLAAGANSITLTGTEADRGASRGTINTSTLTRNFTVEGTGPSVAINHASGATIAEPFFKTVVTVPTGQGITASDIKLFWNGYEQLPLVENPVGSGKFESTFTGRYRQGGVDKIFYGAFVNGPHFFEAVITKNGQENRVARRVVFNLYGKNFHDSDGDGIPDDVELNNFLSGRNPGPNRPLPGDAASGQNGVLDNIPNYGEQWSRLNPMNAETFYNGTWDGDLDSDGDGVKNLEEIKKGYQIAGDPVRYSIYDRNSVPPASVGSFASSALSLSGGNKIITVTYRPNDGPLANASGVTINFTPTGGGSPQSFTMTGGPTEYTYSYTVPAGATSVSYTFSNGGTTDSTGGASWSASTTAAFVMDGLFDSEDFLVTDSGMRIYAAVRGNKLYTATWSTKGGNNDHFIFITDQFGNPVNHPWAKAGRIFMNTATKPWIGANPDAAFANNFGAAGRNWLGNQGKAMETEIDLVQVFGSVPRILYIAVGVYPRANGSDLIGQAPASFGNESNDIEVAEFQAINSASIRDENLDGRFDVGAPELITSVNGNEADGNYGLRRFYLDEVAGDESSLTVKFRPNAGSAAVSDVQVFTNLNRRDQAVLEEDPSTVTTSSNTYFRAYAMSGPDAQGFYTATLPVNLCGAYRLQVRYKVAGVNGGNFIYYTDHAQRRDCAIVVSPKKALDVNMYEVNPLIVEAKDTTFAGRSTFLDLVNDPAIPGEAGGFEGRPDALNKNHYAALGANMLWLQPIHPIGVEGRDINPETPGQPFDPGSPYAVRDYWSVAPMLARNNSASGAMTEFQTFVSRLDQWGVGVMMDGTFNHSAPDAIMGQGATDLGLPYSPSAQIRNANPAWYAKQGFPAQPAANAAEIAVAPDRSDFGDWTDVREIYFGNYDTLVKAKGTQNADKSYPDNAHKFEFLLERDEFFGHTASTRQVWEYFAYYPIYWLEQSGHPRGTPKEESHKGIDGLRCDFAQGLPSQFWEYCINKTRTVKYDFIFMAESLDGFRDVAGSKRHGVGYRSARHFDALNESIVFYWRDNFFNYPANGGTKVPATPKTFDTFKAYDDRRNAFDNVTLLNNLVSHDEVFPHNDVWALAYAYAQVGALDGIPMLLYGQEAGAQNNKAAYAASEAAFGPINVSNNFAKYENNFGKNIPNFKVYNDMSSIWNSRTADEWKLQTFYGRVNQARLAAPALRSQNVYFLNKKQVGGGYDDNIFAVGKVLNPGQSAGAPGQSVVFAFANNNYRVNTNVAASFDVNAAGPGGSGNYFGIQAARTYNLRDLLADNSAANVWATNKTGTEILTDGIFVGLPNTTAGTGGYQAQYLQLIDMSAPTITFNPPASAAFGSVVTLSASNSANAPVTYSVVGGDADKVTLNGNQLTIGSGTGSVTVRATVAETPERAGAQSEKIITFAKAAQTITFTLDPATGTVGGSRALGGTASSGLTVSYTTSNPAVATVSGSTLTFTGAGTATITAVQNGNDNFAAATSVARQITVSSAGASFGDLFPGQQPGDDLDGDGIPALLEYGMGGTTNHDNSSILPEMDLDGGKFTLTALIRTNDSLLTNRAVWKTNLAGPGAWQTSNVTWSRHSNQDGVGEGFERRVFSIDEGTNPAMFMRLQFELQGN